MEECLTIQILWEKRKFTTFEISKYINEYNMNIQTNTRKYQKLKKWVNSMRVGVSVRPLLKFQPELMSKNEF